MSYRHVAAGDHEPELAPGHWPGQNSDLSDPLRMLAQLQQKLASLPTIEQAKGVLMARFSLEADAAFALLVRWSQSNNVKLRTVSARLTAAASDPGALQDLVETLQQRTAHLPARGPEGLEVQILDEEARG